MSSSMEEGVFQRPSPHSIKAAWKELFSDPLISVASLKAAALTKQGLGEQSEDGGILLRSVYWRFYHNLLPSPTSLERFSTSLATSRNVYTSLQHRYLLAPDGRWASDCSTPSADNSAYPSSPGAGPSRQYTTSSPILSADSGGWDPLSLDGQSPWKTWFAHLELRGVIRQDVERTFPDIKYFELERVRRGLTTILFLYSVLNPDVGYRQGIHELLAVCFLAVDRDSLDPSIFRDQEETRSPLDTRRDVLEEAMLDTLDRRYVEHDAYALFMSLMESAKPFYEWRSEEGPGRRAPGAPQAPIIIRCNHLHTALIGRIDPQLWERLETEGVEAQIWAIRWIRLIFTRELPFALAMRIWDGVFAEDTTLGILDFVAIAMLLLIRNELIEADYPTLLTNLLHYPAPSPTYPFSPTLILSQALFLRDNICPASGVQVVIQNQDMLGIRAQPPERPVEAPSHRGGRGGVTRGVAPRGARAGRAGVGATAGMQGFAQGWIERAQAAGLDKAILSTVADLRKNLPDTSSAYAYLPTLPFSPLSSPPPREPSGTFSTIPNSASALPSRNPHWPPPPRPASASTRPNQAHRPSQDSIASVQTLRDAEREMAELRLAMVGMGKAMGEWLEVLHGKVGVGGGDGTDEVQDALQGFERVKQSLLDAGVKDTEEIVKQWGWHDGLEAPSSRSQTPANAGEGEVKAALATNIKEAPPTRMPKEETTPTPRDVTSFPHASNTHPVVPPSSGLTSSAPQLFLSKRTDLPISSFSRAPGQQARVTSPTVTSGPQGRSPIRNPDPLDGLGVQNAQGQAQAQERWRRPKQVGGGDPLGAGP